MSPIVMILSLLNLWQRISAEHWDGFAAEYQREQGHPVPEHWRENVESACGGAIKQTN